MDSRFRQWPDPDRVQVRAWDRAEQRSIYVNRETWDGSRGYWTVTVYEADTMQHYAMRKADIDFRYFGEPPDADGAARREWARRQAADRRNFWRYVHELSDWRLAREVARCERDGDGEFFLHVARTELARRERGRKLGARP